MIFMSRASDYLLITCCVAHLYVQNFYRQPHPLILLLQEKALHKIFSNLFAQTHQLYFFTRHVQQAYKNLASQKSEGCALFLSL